MSTTNSIIAGIAGAAIASAGWYFAGQNSEESTNAEPSFQKSAEMVSGQSLMAGDSTSCPQKTAHVITFLEAQKMVTDYLLPANTYRLTYDGTNTLKGWYLDRCIIESLFQSYPNADGLQVYVGTKYDDAVHANVNTLIWMASQLLNDNGTMVRENCISVPNTVMDYAVGCPINCPTKNNLP